ncbi:hypothetical protein ANCCAN_01349 [Ancylostoma caninum]|uniref:Uncharacterized protein n=1 Tax=Ancylostoma caninum TaxID=29170 RepID=A0A368H9K7_ANCCA|nr:hypothetical protein ANCCAN_01349 [Ancylostoma caninum]
MGPLQESQQALASFRLYYNTYMLPSVYMVHFFRISPTTTLCNLKFLSLGACPLDDVNCVLPALKGMCSLERFLYCETPLVEKTEEIAKELPSVRLIPHYL